MSSLFNQTNITQGTPFASGSGSSGSNFTTINVSTINFATPVGAILTTYPAVENAPGGLVVGTSNNTQAITAEQLCFGQNQFGVGQYNKSLWTQTGLTTQGNSTGTMYPNVIQFNSQTSGTNNDTLSMFRLSTIGVATGSSANGQQINMVALASTLKSVYPSIVL